MEEWRLIIFPSKHKYWVSNKGRIKSERKVLSVNRLDGKGYPNISLYRGDGTHRQFRVHTLVALAFIPNPENKPYVNHKDSNLEWCTASENTIHGAKYGNVYKPNKKINESTVDMIRLLYSDNNLTQREIAAMFKLGQAQISRIINYKNWETKRIKSLNEL